MGAPPHYFSRYIPKATRVIVPNQAGRDQVERYWRIEPDRFLLLGHPTPDFALEAGARPAPPRDALARPASARRYLLYPAQFWAHKNHATVFDALALLGPATSSCGGIGQGAARAPPPARRRERVSAPRALPRLRADRGADRLYRHAHALTYVSLFGPENLPPLEAMALGCPVVAADVPGAREQLGDAALRVPPLEPAAIADAVRRVENEQLRSELIESGRRVAAERTASDYVGGVISFLDEFADIRRGWR